MDDVTEILLERNRDYAQSHELRPPLPSLNTIVICCSDARVDPAHILGIRPGEVVVLRNAGGRVTQAIERDVALLVSMASRALGHPAQPEIVVMHHTQCGVEMLARPEVVTEFERLTGIPEAELASLAIVDPAESLRRDVGRLIASRCVSGGCHVTAMLYDQTSGRAEVVSATSKRE